MFIVAVISAIVSAPLALSVQYLIMNVLSKQGVSDEELEKERQRYQDRRSKSFRTSLGVSPASSAGLVEKSGGSLMEDLSNLLKELSAHYKALVERGCEEEAKELQGKSLSHHVVCDFFPFSRTGGWGSLVSNKSSKLVTVSSRLDQLSSHLSKSASRSDEETKDLMKELGRVRKEVFREYRTLEGLGGDEEEEEEELVTLTKRQRLLFLFVKDVSSGVSGEMLSSKSQRDSQMSGAGGSGKVNRVSWRAKWSAGLFVGLLDAGMLFYVFLFAMNQTHSRQQAWFVSFVMWLGLEIFLSSTALVLVLHLLVPLYVWSDVSEMKKRVLKDLMAFREAHLKTKKRGAPENDIETGLGSGDNRVCSLRGGAGDLEDCGGGFNAAKYLYTSWRVASLFPKLPESQLVLQFSTPWPKKKFGKEEGKVAKEYEDHVLLAAASKILLYFLGSLLHCSSLVQDIVIQTVCNGGLGYLCVLLVQLWAIHPWLAVLVVLVLLLCLFGLGRISLSGLAKKLAEEEDSEVDEAPDIPPEAVPSVVPLSASFALVDTQDQVPASLPQKQTTDECHIDPRSGENWSEELHSRSDDSRDRDSEVASEVFSDDEEDEFEVEVRIVEVKRHKVARPKESICGQPLGGTLRSAIAVSEVWECSEENNIDLGGV
jgi:hypothetical protein